MSNAVGKNLKAFLEQVMASHGLTLLAAASLPGAKAAQEQDFKDARLADGTRSTGEWLKNYDGKGFKSVDEREAAFADGQYRTSESYRQAVARMAADTSNEIMGVVNPSTANIPTAETLIKEARFDLFKARKDELFHLAASSNPVTAKQAQLDLLQFHLVPENAALEAELDRTERQAKPLEYALRDAQARGERVGTPLPPEQESKPSDPAEGEAQATNQHASGVAVTPWNS